MEFQIKKPSDEDGLGTSTTYEDSNMPPSSYGMYLNWKYLEPDEIKSAKSPEVKFPIDACPLLMKKAVMEAVDFNQCPVPIAAGIALGAISASTQAHFDVSRDENQVSPISLSLITIAESGERKTSTDKPFAKCFYEWELSQRNIYNLELEKYKNQLKAFEIASKEIGKGEINQNVIYRALDQLEQPIKPIQKTILNDRVTIEKLISNLADYPIAYLNSNEAGAILGGYAFKSENFQSAITTLNQLWDGVQIKHDTRGGNLLLIPKPRVTINLLLQESVYRNFCDGNDGLAFSTGALSRFLISQPTSTIGSRLYRKAPEGMPSISAFNTLVKEYLAKPANFENGVLQTKVLTLSPEAKRIWIDFHDNIESELAEGGQLYMIRGWGAKAAEQVVRVAANFQVLSCKDPKIIDSDSLLRSIQVVSYYLNESLRLSTSSKSRECARVLNWLIKHAKRLKTPYIVRYSIQQNIHNDLRNTQKIDDALTYLEQEGFIQCQVLEGKSYVYLNPHLLVDESMLNG